MIAGVAGGLGDYTGVDPVFYRIGFILLSVAGGSGVLLYALGWLLIPEENQASSVGLTLIERLRGRRWLAFMVLGILALFVSDWVQQGDQTNWNLLGAVALVAIGFVLLRDEPSSEVATRAPIRESAGSAPPFEVPARRRRKPRSPLGFMTLGGAFVAVAVASLLVGSNAVELDIGQFIALVVTTLGLGLVVGAWWGRARLLVVLATLLVPVMVLGAMIDVPLNGSLGQDHYGPRRDAQREYRLLAGAATVDLSRYRFGNEPTEIDLSFVAGDMDVYVPPGVDVTVTGALDVGVYDLFGDGDRGRNLAFSGSYERDGLTEGELVINVDGGFGSFDTTWATWIDQQKRYKMRRQERKERRERQERKEQRERQKERAEVKKDGRGRDSK